MTETIENPLRTGMRLERAAPPCAIVIFGASGDLTKRKLVPALYRLSQERLIPAEFAVIGTARQQMSDDEFRERMQEAVAEFSEDKAVDEATWQSFANGLFYIQGDFNDENTYRQLSSKLETIDKERATQGNRIFYLATAPDYFGLIAQQLGRASMAHGKNDAWTRLIIEKPFGHDFESAKELNLQVASVFDENQIYRIDHYLGKETVQNLLVFRFANSIFEPL